MNETEITRIAGLLFGWVLGGIATLIGLAGVLMTAWNMQQDKASMAWPQVAGEIIHSSIQSDTTRSRSGRTTRSDTDYMVELRYTYEVEGQPQKGHRIRFGSRGHDKRSDAQREQRQFSKGKRVPVYYDPEKPARSVLVRGARGNMGQLIGLSICLLIGLTILFFTLRATFKKPDSPEGGT